MTLETAGWTAVKAYKLATYGVRVIFRDGLYAVNGCDQVVTLTMTVAFAHMNRVLSGVWRLAKMCLE